jgi:hypothetical protein
MSAQHIELARLALAGLTARERAALLRDLTGKPEQAQPDRILKRVETAARLSQSLRAVDRLAAQGALHRVRLPGRSRACGFRESEVAQLVGGAA